MNAFRPPEALPLLVRRLSAQELLLRWQDGAEEHFQCAQPLPDPVPFGVRVEIQNPSKQMNVQLFPVFGTDQELLAVTSRALISLCGDHLETLVNHIAHDLRNLFFTVSLQAEIACRNPSQAKQNLEIILHQLERVQQYLERLLLYGRKPTLSLITLDVDTFLREKLRAMRALWPQDQPPLSFSITVTGGPGVARWDPQLLGYALEAVLDNAFRATPPRQEVTVRLQGQQDWVLIEVQDYGSGIPPDKLAQVFFPMAVRRPHGFGLGLPIARKLVEAHGGTLELSSSPDGTLVQIRLPRQAHAG